jgi:uncharacterized paraquat-inducible protein A
MFRPFLGSMITTRGTQEMRPVISTDRKTDTRPAMTRSRGQHTVSCSCGQQLDVCARAHCPRCGRNLHRG